MRRLHHARGGWGNDRRTVTIHHSFEKRLKIHKTEGAAWEWGEWKGPTQAEIRERLVDVMKKYHECREQDESLDYPQFELWYPTTIGGRMREFGLPEQTECVVLDLPGLKHAGDAGNAKVIEAGRDALCLVTYSSDENDPIKQKQLLEQIVTQVKELGGTPNRMIFVINKIDLFRKDDDWPNSEEAAVSKITRQIRAAIAEHLPEYADDVDQLVVAKLSSHPALCAQAMRVGAPEQQQAAAKTIDSFYGELIPESFEDLPRKVSKWETQDFVDVGAAVWKASYADVFDRALVDHVEHWQPELVIPPMLDRFVRSARPCAEWMTQHARAMLNATDDAYEGEMERLRETRSRLKQLGEKHKDDLLKPFRAISDLLTSHDTRHDNDLPDLVKSRLLELRHIEPYTQLREGTLAPLYSWPTILDEAIEAVLWAIKGGKHSSAEIDSETAAQLLPGGSRDIVKKAIARLIRCGYDTRMQKKGGTMTGTNDSGREKVEKLHKAFVKFQEAVEFTVQFAIRAAADREIRRIYRAVREMLRIGIKDIAKKTGSDSTGIGLNSFALGEVNFREQLKFDFKLNTDFEVTQEIVSELKQAKRAWYDPRSWVMIPKRVVVKQTHASIELPPIVDVIKKWMFQVRYQRPAVMMQFNEWLIDQILVVTNEVDNYQTQVIEVYGQRLKSAREKAKTKRSVNQGLWSELLGEAQEFAESLQTVRTLPRPPKQCRSGIA